MALVTYLSNILEPNDFIHRLNVTCSPEVESPLPTWCSKGSAFWDIMAEYNRSAAPQNLDNSARENEVTNDEARLFIFDIVMFMSRTLDMTEIRFQIHRTVCL